MFSYINVLTFFCTLIVSSKATVSETIPIETSPDKDFNSYVTKFAESVTFLAGKSVEEGVVSTQSGLMYKMIKEGKYMFHIII